MLTSAVTKFAYLHPGMIALHFVEMLCASFLPATNKFMLLPPLPSPRSPVLALGLSSDSVVCLQVGDGHIQMSDGVYFY